MPDQAIEGLGDGVVFPHIQEAHVQTKNRTRCGIPIPQTGIVQPQRLRSMRHASERRGVAAVQLLNGGQQQTLAETPGTCAQQRVAALQQRVNMTGFVYVQTALKAQGLDIVVA